MITDKSGIIEKYIGLLGNNITVVLHNGSEIQAKAVIQKAWTKMKLHFEESASKAGRYTKLYYYYIGPPSLDITVLTEQDTVVIGADKFYFTQKEAVKINNIVQYYRGMLKKAEEEEDVFIK